MGWIWAGLAIALAGLAVFCRHRGSRRVDEEHCPYKVGTDRTDCAGIPCEAEPPCRQFEPVVRLTARASGHLRRSR